MELEEKYRKGTQQRIGKYFWVCLLLSFGACDAGFDTLPSGLEYKFITRHDSTQAQDGDYVMMDLLVRAADDSVLFSTRSHGTLFPFRYDSYKMKVGLDNPLEEGFHLMTLGDSVHFRMPADELYKSTFGVSLPDSLDAREYVSVFAKAVDIYDYNDYRDWRTQQLRFRKARLQETQEARWEEEADSIQALLEREGREYRLTTSGIGYYLTEEGRGGAPAEGDTVHFTYEVRYSDGAAIPGELGSSGPEGKSFVMGMSNVLPCWQESVALLAEGGKGRFYFPSSCAFGDSGAYGIRPHAILVVDLHLLNIR